MKISRASGATLAGSVLILVGAALILRAIPFWQALDSPLWQVLVPLLGLPLGAAKGVFILRRTAARMVARLETLPERFWIWRIYPAYFYPFVGVMIAAGVTVRVRFGESAPGVVAALYLGIGVALLSSGGPYFRAAHSARALTAES